MYTLLIAAIQMFIAEIILRDRETDTYDKSETGRVYSDCITLSDTEVVLIDVREFKSVRKHRRFIGKNKFMSYSASLRKTVNGKVTAEIIDSYPPLINSVLLGNFILLYIACVHINQYIGEMEKQ